MSESFVHEQFESMDQQKEAATLGMWTFLATEVLFFGGLILSYTVLRISYPDAVAHASEEMNVRIGSINTAVLLTSSLTMAFAVHAARKMTSRAQVLFLLATAFLGTCFLGLKAYEYYDDISKHLLPSGSGPYSGPAAGPMRLFFWLYYVMTGLHATHLTIGIGLVLWTARKAASGRFSKLYDNPVEMVGLYWHFVDVVWVFLYPLIYLVSRGR